MPETQTLAYLLSIAGQLYIAIIIAFLIGKYLMEDNSVSDNPSSETKEKSEFVTTNKTPANYCLYQELAVLSCVNHTFFQLHRVDRHRQVIV